MLLGAVWAVWYSVCLSGLSEAPKQVVQALQQCHHVGAQIMAATCSEQYSDSTVLFEPLDAGLPAGLLASPALVRVITGTAYIPVVNVGSTDVILHPRTAVGTLDFVNVVHLPSGVTKVPSSMATMSVRQPPLVCSRR